MRKIAIAVATSLFAVAGCGSDSQPGVVAGFQAALPAENTLKIDVPQQSGQMASSLTVGQTADFYLITRATSEAINGHVGGVLAVLWIIVHTPPTQVMGDTALWGPSQPQGLEPLSYRLVVTRTAAGIFTYHLDARPRASTSEGDFQAIITGNARPSVPAGHGSGDFSVNGTVGHALDPVAWKAVGTFAVTYDLGSNPASVAVHYDNVAEPPAQPITADYRFTRAPDGSGDFQFSAHADMIKDTQALEDGIIRSRWNAQGAGRSDARVTGGDAGTGVNASECWDTAFKRVYVLFTPMSGTPASEGNASACVFMDTLLP